MIRLEREEALKKWQEFWDQMKYEWFKIEVLQDYWAEDDVPSLQAWKRGDKETSRKLLKEMESDLADKPNVKKIRIHVVEEPHTEYLQWEVEHYKNINIPKGGEEVYLVAKLEVAKHKLPDGDFCIFDNKRVVKNTYNPDGLCIAMDFYEETDDISYFLELKKELIKLAKPVT